MVFSHGLMVPNIKAIGERIKLMEKELSGMFMETSLKAIGKMTKPTVTAFTPTVTELVMKATGNMICSMVGV